MSIFIDEMISMFEKVEVASSPNYRMMMVLRDAMRAEGFSKAYIPELISKLSISVTTEFMDMGDSPQRLAKAMIGAVARIHEQLVKDFGEENADKMLLTMSSQFTLDIS